MERIDCVSRGLCCWAELKGACLVGGQFDGATYSMRVGVGFVFFGV